MKNVQRVINGKNVTVYIVDKDLEAQINLVLGSGNDELIDEYFLLIHKQQLRDRANTRRHQSLEASLEGGHEFTDGSQPVDEQVAKKIEKERLYEALKELSRDQRWLVKQIYILGRSHTEIAEQEGVSRQAIENRLRKILNKLKNILQKEGC